MVIVELKAGLGNQLFQIAHGYANAKEKSCGLYLAGEIHPDIYNSIISKSPFINLSIPIIPISEIKKLQLQKGNTWFGIFPRKVLEIYEEADLSYLPYIGKKRNHLLLRGFWQSEKYFKKYRVGLLELFKFSTVLDKKNKNFLAKIKLSQSISIHVRRGDYITIPANFSKHGTCSVDYLKSAILKLSNLCKNPSFFIFTDDLQWVKENILGLANKMEIIEGNEGINSWLDIYLMSNCKHNIIANSSFSWWGAWLNANENKKVIAPFQWFADEEFNKQAKDIIPEEWKKI